MDLSVTFHIHGIQSILLQHHISKPYVLCKPTVTVHDSAPYLATGNTMVKAMHLSLNRQIMIFPHSLKNLRMVVLPRESGVSEKVSWVLKQYSIASGVQPHCTLCLYIPKISAMILIRLMLYTRFHAWTAIGNISGKLVASLAHDSKF